MEKNMKIAICDDQSAHIDLLKPYIEEFFQAKEADVKISCFLSGNAILEDSEKFDIIFLDIELGDTTGIEVAKQLKARSSGSVIIVVTSYTDYLDDAMDLHVTRFLSKPVSQSKVFSALEKALQEINEKLITLCTKNNEIIRLKSRDIVYIEAKLKAVSVHTAANTYTVKESLKSIRASLSSSDFAVPHNSFIVNMNYISKFKREEILLDKAGEKITIRISNRKQPEFKKRFMAFVGAGE